MNKTLIATFSLITADFSQTIFSYTPWCCFLTFTLTKLFFAKC